MDFSFSEQQEELRRAARRFLQAESSEARVRSAMETEQGYDSRVWEQLSEELAWTALTIPEAYDGLGMSYLDLLVATELVKSKGDARRLIRNGGAYLNNEKVEDEALMIATSSLVESQFLLVGAGKKKKIVVKIASS